MKNEIDDRLDPWEVDRRQIIARRFRQMRKQYRVTQKELAIAGDVHVNTISNIERQGNISTEEFYRWQNIAERTYSIKKMGAQVSKLSVTDISFKGFKSFISELWG